MHEYAAPVPLTATLFRLHVSSQYPKAVPVPETAVPFQVDAFPVPDTAVIPMAVPETEAAVGGVKSRQLLPVVMPENESHEEVLPESATATVPAASPPWRPTATVPSASPSPQHPWYSQA